MVWDGKMAKYFYNFMTMNGEQQQRNWWTQHYKIIEQALRRKRNNVSNVIKKRFMGKFLVHLLSKIMYV